MPAPLFCAAAVKAGNINTVVNFADVPKLIKAFQGEVYPFGPAHSAENCPFRRVRVVSGIRMIRCRPHVPVVQTRNLRATLAVARL